MKTLEWWLKWGATALILTATVATSFDFTPLNKWLFLLGSLCWAWVGFLWKQPSLILLNSVTSAIYIAGIYY